jgi:hypothetical protein
VVKAVPTDWPTSPSEMPIGHLRLDNYAKQLRAGSTRTFAADSALEWSGGATIARGQAPIRVSTGSC